MATMTFGEWVRSENIDLSTLSESDIPKLRERFQAATGTAPAATAKKDRKASLVTFELRIPTGEDGVYHAFPRPDVPMVPGRGADQLRSNVRELLELQAMAAGLDVSDAEFVVVSPAK